MTEMKVVNKRDSHGAEDVMLMKHSRRQQPARDRHNTDKHNSDR